MKVFVTGHLGYVGTVLANMVVQQNYDITGCDVGYYPQNFIETEKTEINFLKKDIRDITLQDLEGHDAVLHLAALSNDPLGELNSSITHDINFLATQRLAKLAKEAKVRRFIFSSSCSSYGTNEEIVSESSTLTPLTSYAKSKVDSESELLKLKDENFIPTIMRSATAYGISPNLRLDLVVNNLTASAYTTGSVKLLSDGTAWRPLVHVEDMSNAFIRVLQSSEEKISGQIFNVGSNENNYRVKQIAELVEEFIPNSKIEYAKNANKDTRSYQVNFNKIKNDLGFKTKWNLQEGIKNIHESFKKFGLTEDDFKDKKFHRVKYIKWLREMNILDSDLKMTNSLTQF